MDIRQQAITGVIPPDLARGPYSRALAECGTQSRHCPAGTNADTHHHPRAARLAPDGRLVLSKIGPIFLRRYTLTNRRLMIRKGWKGKVVQEVPLEQIDEVRLVTDGNSDFSCAGNLEIISNGKVVMTLAGVPEPESYKHSIINARNAWVPGKVKTLPSSPRA